MEMQFPEVDFGNDEHVKELYKHMFYTMLEKYGVNNMLEFWQTRHTHENLTEIFIECVHHHLRQLEAERLTFLEMEDNERSLNSQDS